MERERDDSRRYRSSGRRRFGNGKLWKYRRSGRRFERRIRGGLRNRRSGMNGNVGNLNLNRPFGR